MIGRSVFVVVVFASVVTPLYGEVHHLGVRWDSVSNTYQTVNPHTDQNHGSENEFIAWGRYENAVNSTGWAYLEVYTNASYSNVEQAFGAGIVEGHLTKSLLDMHWRNTYNGYCAKPLNKFCDRLQKFFDKNVEWMASMINSAPENDTYWHQVRLFLEQMAGLSAGYYTTEGNTVRHTRRDGRKQAQFKIDVTTIDLMQFSGDLEDLEVALKPSGSVPSDASPRWPHDRVLGSGSCSSLIKLLPGNKDLYVAQDTWNVYQSMLRILKKYDFPFRLTAGSDSDVIPGQVMTFSSYPGILLSGDDFYTISSGLVSIETTIGNSNTSLYSLITPGSVIMEEIRNTVANRVARTGPEWTRTFAKYNSGTYNNDWMIVDYKLFKPGQPLQDGLLNIVETLPGYVSMQDVTQLFAKQTYWPSYNIPYFPDIFRLGGNQPLVDKFGEWFSYDGSPRAKIFKRDHTKVQDLDSMVKLMRYNDFTHDPLSRCNCTPPYSAENTISARSDLNPADGRYPFSALGHRAHGGIDMKLTSSGMARDLEFLALSSPAYDDVPPFDWSTSPFRTTVAHEGHPNLWKFPAVQHKWGKRP